MSQIYGPSPFEYQTHECCYCGSPCTLPWVREGKKYCSQKCLLSSGNGPKMVIKRYDEMLKIDNSKIKEVKKYQVGSEYFTDYQAAVRHLHKLEFRKWMSDLDVEAGLNGVISLIANERETIQQYYGVTETDRDVLEKAVEVLNKADKEYAVLNKADKDYAVRVLRHLNTALNHDSI